MPGSALVAANATTFLPLVALIRARGSFAPKAVGSRADGAATLVAFCFGFGGARIALDISCTKQEGVVVRPDLSRSRGLEMELAGGQRPAWSPAAQKGVLGPGLDCPS